MNQEEQILLNTIQCALAGDPTVEEVSSDTIAKMLALANAHKLAPILVDAIYMWPVTQAWPEYPTYKRTARMLAMSQMRRAREFLEIYQKLIDAGVEALVVKGCVCRAVWLKGDLRISGDEDLYVRDEDFAKACAVLRDCGLRCDDKANPETDFEIGWRKPNSALYIELHRRLFMPGSAADLQVFFDDAFDRAREYEVEHGAAKVWSMSPEDHLLYLILHAYKHFIHSGFGIRQVCDIGLWQKCYRGEVDHNRIMRNLEKAHALYFAAGVFAIAQEDLGIDLQLPECWAAIQVDREPMLQDLLDAGVYGGSSMSRQHSAPLTVEAVAASRDNRKKKGLLQRAFPSKDFLVRDYPELQEHPEQLPAVWLKRLKKYRKETKNDENNTISESIRIAKEREELLKLYRII